MLNTLISHPKANMIVDLDRISMDHDYRNSVTCALREVSGLPSLSFDDARLPQSTPLEDADYAQAIREETTFFTGIRLS